MGFRTAELLRELRAHGSAENLAGMARFGVATGDAYGVPLAEIRPLARRMGKNHALALELWVTGVREARELAILVADPARMTSLNGPLGRADPFLEPPKADVRPQAWFAMFAALAIHDKEAPDERFLNVLSLIPGQRRKRPQRLRNRVSASSNKRRS